MPSGKQIVDKLLGSIPIWLSSVEIVQINEVTRAPCGLLHRSKMLKRTYRNRHARHLDVNCPCAKLSVRQDAIETLNHIQIPELCGDQRPFPAAKQGRDGMLRAEQRLTQLDMATTLGYKAGKPIEVFWRRIGHDVAILRSPHDAPRPKRQAANDNEAHIRLNETDEELVERRCAQWARRAASRNSNSLRVKAIVSWRFTTSGRCPSARSRNRRTRSPSGS
jgi:hypothetical protein